jgi:hypothetical protein
MMHRLARIAEMDRREIVWRAKVSLRIAADRTRFAAKRPRWHRRALSGALADRPDLLAARRALSAASLEEAECELSRHFATRAPRFVVAPALRHDVSERVRRAYPESVPASIARANRILAGEYDLLGYRGLRFNAKATGANGSRPPDWTWDPVHDRRPPDRAFWSAIQYLSAECGDHKIIWELNRHQHWLALGRAYWLTGDGRYRQHFIDELANWLAANPPLAGINWASMLELGLRSLSWLWALHLFAEPSRGDDGPWVVDLLGGLDRQLTQVERNLSRYFSPNTHLLGEALALYVCGRALPELKRSGRWTTVGRRVLLDEIDRQVAADGGHCERSTHYHRYALDFYLLALAVARITGDDAETPFERAAARLAEAARLLADGTGRMPHIGDDDGGVLAPFGGRSPDDLRDSLAIGAALTGRPELAVGPPPEELHWWLAHPLLTPSLDTSVALAQSRRGSPQGTPNNQLPGSGSLPATGYYVSRSAGGDHVVIDGGPHGYLNGGHAHADSLSITLSVNGAPVLIDPGTGCYTPDAEVRDRLRSTALHNTVVVDGRAQSVSNGPFQWTRTASALVRRWRTNEAFDYFEGEHDGYRPTIHRRHVFIVHADLLVVFDFVDGPGPHAAAAHWHVDPRWHVECRGSSAVFRHSGSRIDFATLSGPLESFTADTVTGLGWHAPVYGPMRPATTLRVMSSGPAPLLIATVVGLAGTNAVTGIEQVPVWSEAGALRHSIALKILREASTDMIGVADPAGESSTTWRILDLETDARLLFCRIDVSGRIGQVAMVDGSMIRSSARRSLQLLLPKMVSDLHVDLRGEPRIAGPASGARLIVGE